MPGDHVLHVGAARPQLVDTAPVDVDTNDETDLRGAYGEGKADVPESDDADRQPPGSPVCVGGIT